MKIKNKDLCNFVYSTKHCSALHKQGINEIRNEILRANAFNQQRKQNKKSTWRNILPK